MSYRRLYDQCQSLRGRIGRRQLFPMVCALTGLRRPRLMLATDLDQEDLLGHIYFPNGGGTQLDGVCQGAPLITVGKSLPEKWQRLAMLKELMHYFDFGREKISTPRELEDLISGLLARTPQRSAAVYSEDKALWMALGVMCQEERRQELQRMLAREEVTLAQISDELGMPEEVVPFLFDPRFKDIIDYLLNEDD